ncbi:MAG: Asp-tRNA(Asn)/Glu-tRNA(Gln) amidotransferase subunit GatB [Candidatus Omnitrophota bacterium]
MEYEPVIGLEVHLQLSTKTKAFCGCSTRFGQRPNSQTCPVCLGFPGSLPKLNARAFSYAVKVALALKCEVQKTIKFDRKNYYYPDLPKNFQISQFDKPIAYNGEVMILSGGKTKKIRIRRVHLEEDAGKLIHDTPGSYSLVDYNRAGIPLLEIVTEPDINSPDEAYGYLTNLKAILKYLDVSDCDMEKGSLRCDANISVRPRGTDGLGSKVELKNMNSFKGVKGGLEYEVRRQVEAVAAGERIPQETRLWDAEKSVTVSMRTKEEAHDYRYFPEPDLVPFVDSGIAKDITVPELPEAKAKRFRDTFGLSEYDAGVLTAEKEMADYFERCVAIHGNAKTVTNWLTGEMMAQLNERNMTIGALGVPAEGLAGLLKMIDDGSISGKIAKTVLAEMIETKSSAADIVKAKGLAQISDAGKIEEIARSVIAREEKTANDYKNGKTAALAFLVGQVMKETKGKANPALVNGLLKKLLGGEK